MKKRTFLWIGITVSLTSIVWILLTSFLLPTQSSSSRIEAPHKGFYAPDFTLETIEGEPINLSELRGQPVLVFLWASWCSVCKTAMPGLQPVYNDYASLGFEILAVNMAFQDSLSTAKTYFQAQGFTYPMLLDRDGSMAKDYQLHALPTSILVAPDGKVLDVIIGFGLTEGLLRSRLDKLLISEESD